MREACPLIEQRSGVVCVLVVVGKSFGIKWGYGSRRLPAHAVYSTTTVSRSLFVEYAASVAVDATVDERDLNSLLKAAAALLLLDVNELDLSGLWQVGRV